MKESMTIGKLSAKTDVNIETIRYYEKEGILPLPPRTQNGYRDYSKEHVKRLMFVRRSRELGFSLDEIRTLLVIVDGRRLTCAEIKAVTLTHLDAIRKKITDLQKLEKTLQKTTDQCKGGKMPDCPIMDALFHT
ncbi:MAG TPA: helix-turn-helix domain-containing protein [Alphaproteobacteria bacterium]|nr:helix-turn-helix domain-containing protein [Alphaproteobacteria bacterium]